MNIPNALAEQLKLYLQRQAAQGDLEAQMLLAQMEQAATATQPLATVNPSLSALPPDVNLGC